MFAGSQTSLNSVGPKPLVTRLRGRWGKVTTRFASQADARDAARFAGRKEELRLLERVLGDDPPATVVLVHGRGGIGKSSLLRATARLGASMGYQVRWLDGRGSAPTSAEIAGVFDEVSTLDRPLLLIDTYERISALGGFLREHALAALPDTARVVIAGRDVPGWEWEAGPWGAITLRLPLRRLDEEDASELLRRRGVVDDQVVSDLNSWARGEPLALSAGADAVLAGLTFDVTLLTDDASLARSLISRLARDELAGADRDVLAVAAIAHGVDVAMLEAVLSGLDGEHAVAWLRSLSFAEDMGSRVTIHERLRGAMRTELRATDPSYERELRRRLADHLYERATAGEHHLLAELSDLIDDPRIRWGLGIESGADAYADIVRPGDVEAAGAALEDADQAWPLFRRWFVEAPQHVYTVRNQAGELIGFGVWITSDDAPEWAGEDPVVGPRLEHARSLAPPGRAVVSRGGRPLVWGTQKTRAAIANPAMVGRRGVDIRYFYGAGFEGRVQQADFYRAMGYKRVPEMDVIEDGRVVECHLLDMGEEGVIRGMRDRVYRDLGLPISPPSTRKPDLEMEVREALRNFYDPEVLAASVLASGSSRQERYRSVQRILREAVEGAFGDTEHDRLLRATIEEGYLNSSGSHESTARRLHLSRATYFRRLSQATRRVAAAVEIGN